MSPSGDQGNTMQDLFELPLFPLNTVLFPGMPINLHIFEERYIQMIETCEAAQQPFGVVLIQDGQEAMGPLATPYPVGCTAQITQVERLEDGRMNIVAVGLERFRIHSLSFDQPYLVGIVELIPLDEDSHLEQAGDRLRPWVERYLSVLSKAAEGIKISIEHLPQDPLALGYLAAALVQIPTEQKQELLTADQAAVFLTDVRTIYRREVALLKAMMAHHTHHQDDESGLFSRN